MRTQLLLLVFVFSGAFAKIATSQLIAQNSQTFTRAQEFYIRGNSKVIGNNILSKDSKKPFNDIEKVNDEYKMKYVDIDDDNATFSSSAAFLDFDNTSKVKYAALYWTGTYYGERAGKRFKNDRTYYKKLDERAHDFQDIKFKLPGKTYQNIRGEKIFDGLKTKNRTLLSRAPYVCVADVTTLLQNQETVTGNYTVANVAATQGQILGGSSAGWLLYVVFENEQEPLQYITTYHGFEFVNTKEVIVEFGNFRSVDKGEVETALTIGALEGDITLPRDEVAIYNPKEDAFITLDNTQRASNNFFNSSITIGEEVYSKRTPSSLNTLGFDIAKIKIPNEQNAIIANNASGVKLRYKTRSDRFFLFFTAFQTTISEAFFQEINDADKPVVVNPAPVLSMPDTQNSTPVSKEIEENTIDQTAVEINPNEKVEITEKEALPTVSEEQKKELETLDEKPSVTVPELQKGYYIVTNVFSSRRNADNWANTLKELGYTPKVFLRPDNSLYYVHIENGLDKIQLYNELTKVRTNPKLTESWMLKINMD